MRQSLSETQTPRTVGGRRTAWLAVALSLVLAVVAIVDQSGSRSLFDHTASVYAPYSKDVESGTVYGLVYGVAVLNALLWLLVVALARTPRPVAVGVAGVAILLTVALALVLLFVTEYGVHPFPPLWGLLALLPAVAGALALAGFARSRR
ncbi:hypothetical protein [Kribbella shirazensis]|uniref:Uncharacterized protein n=1 Tax=Kribbella shirazensis TaxID=1105143 RepID=A0A7X6A0R1_9ACTN|nr:hypothetical protein [Kribbella shirazensis]NIK57228.1 hypothetical protein [Kribbella shirazensis]